MNNIIKTKGTKKVSDITPEHRRVIFLTENEIDSRTRYELLNIVNPLELAKAVWDIYKEDKAQFIALSEASKNLKFPPGHPCKDSLYIQHPFLTETYFPASDYLRMFYEEKAAEFMSIIGGLKPYRIDFYYIKGAKTFGNVTAAVETGSATVSAETQSSFGFVAASEFKPKGEIDPDLKKRQWLEFEPSWKSIIEQRLDHGLESMDVIFTYSGLKSLSGEVKAIVEEVSGEAGANAIFKSETEWRLHISFVNKDAIGNNQENILKRIKDYITPWKKSA